MNRFHSLLFPVLYLLTCGCDDVSPPAPAPLAGVHFVDVTREAGLDFVQVSGSPQQRYILETMAGGAAFFDYDNDGHLDLFLINSSRVEGVPPKVSNRLYRNKGNGSFEDVTSKAGLLRSGWGMGCAVGDYDRDGDLDLYVTYWGPNALYRNNGDGTFEDVALEAGVDDARWGTSAVFGDVDGDGYPDLYVANYVSFDLANPPGGDSMCSGWKGLTVFCGPQGMDADADVLYRNKGDGSFENISAQAGIDRRVYPALGAVLFDYDADGDLDLYVANDSVPNLLYRNDGDWRLTEVGAVAGVAYSEEGRSQAGMGVDVGDYDGDGDIDLFVTNFSDDVNTLYQNRGDGTFEDATYTANLGGPVRPYLGWSTALCDFDNDGDLDLFIANGHLYPQLEDRPMGLRYAQGNLLYWNEDGAFRPATEAGPALDLARVSRGAAFGDFDNDGDVDLVAVNLNDRPTFLRNEGGNGHNWLGLDLAGEVEGTLIRLVAGDKVLVRQAKRGYGYQSASDGRVLFGLGQRTAVDRIEIRWPSGRKQIIEAPTLRRYLIVREGETPVVADYSDETPTTQPVARTAPAPPATSSAKSASMPAALQNWTAEAYYDTVIALYRQGRYEEALHLAQSGLRRHPDHVRLYYAAGGALYSGLGRYEEAVAVLEQGMARDSSVVEIAKLLGVVNLNLNRPMPAIAAFQRAAQLDSLSWEISYQLGLAHQRLGNAAAAIAAFQRASAQAPQEIMPYLHLARLYEKLGRAEAARQAQHKFEELRPLQEETDRYQQAIRANPDHPEAYNKLGLALARTGHLQEAKNKLEQALDRDPNHAEAHTNLGNILQQLEQTQKAVEHYRRALKLNADLAEAHYGLGMVLHAQKQAQQAITSLQRALELRPDYVKAHTNLAVLLDSQKRLEEAIVHFRKVVELSPKDARAYSNLIVALVRHGQVDAARDYLERASARRLSLPVARKALVQVLIALAHTHAQKGEWGEAATRQRQAIDLTPTKLRPALVEKLGAYQAEL